MVFIELNGHEFPEVVLAQNFFSPQREVELMSGSVGATVLSWKGRDDFYVLEPYQIEVIISGDTKGVSVNEFNGDGIPDLAFTENSGPVSTFLNTCRKGCVGVCLKG
ncbi:MAG: hypothetical protein ACON4R_10095 [Akkermansiaceae bacterium]